MKTEGNNKEKDNPFVEEKKHSKLPVVILFVIGVSILFLGFLRKPPIPSGQEGKTNAADLTLKSDKVDLEQQGESETASEEKELPQRNLQELVEEIRETYNSIEAGCEKGIYTQSDVGEGITAYWDGNKLVKIVSISQSEENEYDRYFYFDGGKLIFAYYEATDSYRFYFRNETLVRERYCKDASDSSDFIDCEDETEFGKWPGYLLQQKDSLVKQAKEAN